MHPMFRREGSRSDLGDGIHDTIAEESESENINSDDESASTSNTPRSPRSSLKKKSKKKSKKKKLKKGFKKAFKLAATPVVATTNAVTSGATMASNAVSHTASNIVTAVTGDQHIFDQSYKSERNGTSISPKREDKNKAKKDAKKNKKKDYVMDSEDEDLDVDSTDYVSIVKYEKVKSRLVDKSDLVDTLLSKVELLEETIAEKDEVILRLQNLDMLADTIAEKDRIIQKLMKNEKVDKNMLTTEFKNNAEVLTHIRTKKRNLESYRQSFRRPASGSEDEFLGGLEASERIDDTFIAWKRHDNEIKSGRGMLRSVPLPGPEFSRATSAQAERKQRLETSDVLHKMRKANKKNKNNPKKKGAEPWKAMHTFLMPAFQKSMADISLISKSLMRNYMFENLNPTSLETFIQAFETVQFEKGHVIMKQGEKVDYFYIVSEGEVSIDKDGDTTHNHGPETSFGATALLYASPPKTTVTAQSDPTKFWRVDQKTFRYTMKRTVKETNRQKMALLKDIPVLKDFENADLQRLCDNMLGTLFLCARCFARIMNCTLTDKLSFPLVQIANSSRMKR